MFDLLDLRAERCVKDNCANISVIPEVDEFVRCVSIVRVDDGHPSLERGENTFDVVRGVIQILSNLVLLDEA
jgi:hypothetical protein